MLVVFFIVMLANMVYASCELKNYRDMERPLVYSLVKKSSYFDEAISFQFVQNRLQGAIHNEHSLACRFLCEPLSTLHMLTTYHAH